MSHSSDMNTSAINGLSDSIDDNTVAIRKNADATTHLAEATDRGRVDITNERYIELKNKSIELLNIEKFVELYMFSCLNFRTSEEFKRFESNSNGLRGSSEYGEFNIHINKNYKFISYEEIEEVILYTNNIFKEEVIYTDNCVYIETEEGKININMDEYNELLYNELLVPEYLNSFEDLKKLSYIFLDVSIQGFMLETISEKLTKLNDKRNNYKWSIKLGGEHYRNRNLKDNYYVKLYK